MQKVALVTGTSSGLGLQLAVLLAKQGYITYATMRNLAKQQALLDAAKAQGVDLIVRQLDVQSSASVTRCFAELMAESGRLDLLVNNAGAGFVRTTEQADEDEIQWVMDVNFHGVVRCTKAALPIMRAQRSGHIVNITSVGGLVGQPFSEFYCAAKFAVEGYTEALASYISPSFNIQFSLVEPGGIKSEFATNTLVQFQQGGGMHDDEYKPILEGYIAAATARASEGGSGVYQSSSDVAQVVLNCIQMDNPPLRMRTSAWSEHFSRLKTESDPTGRLLQQEVINMSLGKKG